MVGLPITLEIHKPFNYRSGSSLLVRARRTRNWGTDITKKGSSLDKTFSIIFFFHETRSLSVRPANSLLYSQALLLFFKLSSPPLAGNVKGELVWYTSGATGSNDISNPLNIVVCNTHKPFLNSSIVNRLRMPV